MHRWELPEKLLPFLTKKKRMKIAYGGRGGAKTESIARMKILLSFKHNKRILCCREVQKSINDSVYQSLKDIILDDKNEVSSFFKIKEKVIINKLTGAEFIFHGLLTHTIESLKSIKGVKYVWVEEGQSVSNNSWRILTPTIREPESEIWVSMNRKKRNDPVWERYCKHPDPDNLIINVNYYDNPFFGDPLKSEMEKCKLNNELEYRHVWLGEPEQINDARVYYNFDRQINVVENQIEINPTAETWTGWDFGVSDKTAIVVCQFLQIPSVINGFIINVIDYYENAGYDHTHYSSWVKNSKWYKVCKNIRHAGDPSGVSRDSSLNSWIGNLRKEGIIIQTPQTNSIEELSSKANHFMKSLRINEQQTPRFIDIIEEWNYPVDKKTNVKIIGSKPEHNELSHGGTAFYYLMGTRFPIYTKSTMKAY